MLATLKALADPTRLRLVAVLARGELTVQELTAVFGMGQSRISRHLKILTEAGVLTLKRQGTWSYYRLAEENSFFSAIWPAGAARLAELPGHQADLQGLARIFDERRRRSRDFFDLHAASWDGLSERLLPVADCRDALLQALPGAGTTMEVGVGTGGLLVELGRRTERVVGVDQSAAMLTQARLRVEEAGLDNIELRLGEMSHLPLGDGEVGCAVLNMVLHHAPRPVAVFREIHRVLGADGRLLVADLQRHDREWVRETLADQWLGFDREELEGWLTEAGFVLESFRLLPGEGRLCAFVLAARSLNICQGAA